MDPISNSMPYLVASYVIAGATLTATLVWLVFDRIKLRRLDEVLTNSEGTNDS